MAEKYTAKEIVELFEEIDGIEALEDSVSGNRALVKVMDESAIGQFFALRRKLGVESTGVTRNGLSHTVLDAWIHESE